MSWIEKKKTWREREKQIKRMTPAPRKQINKHKKETQAKNKESIESGRMRIEVAKPYLNIIASLH